MSRHPYSSSVLNDRENHEAENEHFENFVLVPAHFFMSSEIINDLYRFDYIDPYDFYGLC